ncbi:MAG: hypothetical protein IKK11_02615 [Oscillospiraceae bacterium]|nr:hypothetical protein [Oscillospiraceae bacterium]
MDETVVAKKKLGSISMLKNERYSFQICYDTIDKIDCTNNTFQIQIESPLLPYISMYKVQNISSAFPCYPNATDDNYLRTQPGLYPDLLEPINTDSRLAAKTSLQSVWLR